MAKSIKRENGTGTVYRRKDLKRRPWVAAVPGDEILENGKIRYRQEIIGYFTTAQEAKDALDDYRRNPTTKLNITLEQLHDEWMEIGYRGLSRHTINNYNSGWYKLRTIYSIKFRELRTAQMQKIIDYYSDSHEKEGVGGEIVIDKSIKQPVISGPLSYSSLSKLKALLTMLYAYALENDVVNKNYAKFIRLPEKEEVRRDRFTDLELKQIENAVESVPYASCILMMCYTGYRITEFLQLTEFDVHEQDDIMAIVAGIKTEAGKDRLMPIHRKVAPLFREWINKKGDRIICRPDGTPFGTKYFREECYYPALEQIGVRKLSPHATRRTFSTRMSAAGAREEDMIALMGHADFKVDIDSYIIQELKTLHSAIERMS